jgi:hypothetical protein
MLDFSLSFRGASTATLAFSFLLLFLGAMVESSSSGEGASFLDRVAVRKLCSRDERMRKNALVDSGAGWDVEASEKAGGCWEREEDATGPRPVLRWFFMN